MQFLGGASEVGRSAILLKDKKSILLDYGVKVNHKPEYPLAIGSIDACIISHAHLDHSGAVPILYRSSFPVTFGTKPTAELAELLIEDSIGISRKQHLKPKFSKRQLKSFLSKFVSYNYGSQINFSDYLFTLYDAGHITGSAITLIEKSSNNRRLVYTGDFKIDPQVLQGSADIVKSDILIIESTYATREHPNRKELIKNFIDDLKATLDNGGTALVPCFAVGRSQEILTILYEHDLIHYAYIDGMAKKATEIVMRHPDFTRNEGLLKSAIKNTMWIGEKRDRISALVSPSIIVTTSGMLNGGPVLDYITRLNPRSKIFLTGYQVEGTNGSRLLENKPIRINGKKHQIKIPVTYYDFSAHADKKDLHEYVHGSAPEVVICVHGDKENAQTLAESLKTEGFEAHAPRVGDRIKIEF